MQARQRQLPPPAGLREKTPKPAVLSSTEHVRIHWLGCVSIAILSGGPLALPSLAGEPGSRVEYVGGTLSGLPGKCDGRIITTGEQSLVFRHKSGAVQVPYSQIDLLEYGQKVDRRYAMAVIVSPLLLLSKKRQHFLTVGYIDASGQRQAIVFRVEKDDIRPVLASLEVKTGRKVQYQDQEARKAGKG